MQDTGSVEPTKKALAKELGISRASLYYHPKQPSKDWHLKNQIEEVLRENPAYGHKRIAVELQINRKRVLRVMHLFGLKPYRRRGRKWRKSKDSGHVYPNLLQQLTFPMSTKEAWVSDFTRIPLHSRFVYLATLMDLYDRQVTGWSILTTHSVQLVMTALIDALEKHGRPKLLHSDQGSEYKSKPYTTFAEQLGIKLSMSAKGSPWENGYQEAFYGQLKVDLGDPNRFETLGELTAAIYLQLHYYNTMRIHSALKMPPRQFAEQHRSELLLIRT
jgi:putative transposase